MGPDWFYGNSIAIMLALDMLILIFGPVSGAHFNPVVWFEPIERGRGRRAHVPCQNCHG